MRKCLKIIPLLSNSISKHSSHLTSTDLAHKKCQKFTCSQIFTVTIMVVVAVVCWLHHLRIYYYYLLCINLNICECYTQRIQTSNTLYILYTQFDKKKKKTLFEFSNDSRFCMQAMCALMTNNISNSIIIGTSCYTIQQKTPHTNAADLPFTISYSITIHVCMVLYRTLLYTIHTWMVPIGMYCACACRRCVAVLNRGKNIL